MPAEGDEGEETGQLLEMMHEGYFSQFELPFFSAAKLLRYDFYIVYKQGITNSAADALSRCGDDFECRAISFPVSIDGESLDKELQQDPFLQKLIAEFS